MPKTAPKILFLDIETHPILASVWGLFDENVGLNQIKKDWSIIAWGAKWAHQKEVMYQDNRDAKDLEDDFKLLKSLWPLIDEADIIVTQNGKAFDEKKINARFLIHGFKPPKKPKHIDTKELAKRRFAFTSNKLEYLADKLNKKYKKLAVRGDYTGFELWKACMAGDMKAWEMMEKYNKHDVLALEELYQVLRPWDKTINFDLYHDETDWICTCGSEDFKKQGFAYTASGKYQRYKCSDCGHESRGGENLLTPEKRKSLRRF